MSANHDSLFGAEAHYWRDWREQIPAAYITGGSILDAFSYSMRTENRMREAETCKVHLVKRGGWTRTVVEPSSNNRSDTLRVPEYARDVVTGRETPNNSEPIRSVDFRLVKEAEIRDHKTGTIRKEYWYEEV